MLIKPNIHTIRHDNIMSLYISIQSTIPIRCTIRRAIAHLTNYEPTSAIASPTFRSA